MSLTRRPALHLGWMPLPMTLTRRAGASLALLIAGVGVPATTLLSRGAPARAKTASHTTRRGAEEPVAQAMIDRFDEVDRWEARASRHALETATTATTMPPALVFGWPADGAITGPFGERRGRRRHPGIDIDGETGDPVRAAVSGVVEWAGPAPTAYAGYGDIVLVDLGNGLQTLYAHLSAWSVQPGQAVTLGQRIGSIGATGEATGSHLHFEMRANGVVVDPSAYLPRR